MLDGSVLQRQRADGAALAVGHEQAAPGLLGGRGQARRLREARLVRVGIVSVLLTAAACPSHTRPRFALAVKEAAELCYTH